MNLCNSLSLLFHEAGDRGEKWPGQRAGVLLACGAHSTLLWEEPLAVCCPQCEPSCSSLGWFFQAGGKAFLGIELRGPNTVALLGPGLQGFEDHFCS